MTLEQIITDIGAGIAAVGAISTVLAHLPFLPAKYAEFFARLSIYAANWKFSVNVRETPPKPPYIPTNSMMLILGTALLTVFTACAASNPLVCNPVDAVKLTSAYAANVHLQCQGYSFDACPARPALEADLSKQLENACPTH